MTPGKAKDSALFTDVSLSPHLKLGVGACVMLPASYLEAPAGVIGKPGIDSRIKVQRFVNTSSTRLELQTVLWALTSTRPKQRGHLTIYTDSQCVSGLLRRKSRLLEEGFVSKKTGEHLGNTSLYRRFFEFHDRLGFHLVKVLGHSDSRVRDTVHQIFSCVDKAARRALKVWLKEIAEVSTGKGSFPWCVYVLRCSNNSLYIGMTNDLEKRIAKHQLGTGSKFVRSWRPFELIKTIQCTSAGEARRLECDLKKLTRKKKMEVLDL